MRILIIVISFIVSLLSIDSFLIEKENNNNNNNDATSECKWELANLYDIVIKDGVYYIDDVELLPNNGIIEAINKIMNDDSTAYPAIIQIEIKFIPEENLYIGNLIDEYIVETIF